MNAYKVIHVLRAPVGGLFRHVRDLVTEQSEMGLEVGIICDSSASDRLTSERLASIQPYLALGLRRTSMKRSIDATDVSAYAGVRAFAEETGATVLHGHGAKGGAYARLAAAALRRRGRIAKCFYTPHGGSLNFAPSSLKGRVYMTLERQLGRMTDGLIFESAWSGRIYREQVGEPACPVRVIPNGLLPGDFFEHEVAPDAVDVLYLGELRRVKGIDVLLEALAGMRARRAVTAMMVGDGPDRDVLMAQAANLGLAGSVSFPGAMPAKAAFAKGRLLAIPSRAESFPYIILEAAAAGIPLVTTDVGGIPEIVRGTDMQLIPPEDVDALSDRLEATLDDLEAARATARRLQSAVASQFTVRRMTQDIVSFYEEVGGAGRRTAAGELVDA